MARDNERAAGFDSRQLGRDRTGQRDRAKHPDARADACDAQSRAKHEADDLIESGAEGHADADLDGALGNEARNHPVDPQRREEQPEDGETGPAGPDGHVPAGEPAAGTARTMNRCGAGPT